MLKDTWTDKVDGVDVNSAEDINQVAQAVIDLENKEVKITVDSELDLNSKNPVQNKVVSAKFDSVDEQIAELDIPSKEYIENIANDANSAKTEAMANTAFRVEASPKLEKLREDVDEHQGLLDKLDEDLKQAEADIRSLEPKISYNSDENWFVEVIDTNTIVYCGVIAEFLTIGFVNVGVGYTSALHFSTPAEVPTDYSVFPEETKFKGDSVEDERFVPEANMRYTIVFDYDGVNVIGYVSGVSL